MGLVSHGQFSGCVTDPDVACGYAGDSGVNMLWGLHVGLVPHGQFSGGVTDPGGACGHSGDSGVNMLWGLWVLYDTGSFLGVWQTQALRVMGTQEIGG